MSSIFILGTRIDNYTMKQAVDRARQLLEQGGSHYIVTPNPEILLRAYRDPQLQRILNESSLSLCDGTGAYLAALGLGKRLKGRVTGVDFMQELCAYAASHNNTVALIGGKVDAREKTEKLLRRAYPGLRILMGDIDRGRTRLDEMLGADEHSTETYAGYVEEESAVRNDADRQTRTSLKADFAFVALGSPKQEYWMAQEKRRGSFAVMLEVGGAFDMLSGRTKRAPKLMRRLGIEWAWRIFLEPQRAGRIASAVIVFPYILLRSHFF